MLVKMISTAIGSNDGIIAKKYIKDNVYDLSEMLANCFLTMGVASQQKANAKPTGKGKAVNEQEILNKSMQEFLNKDAEQLLNNKKQEEEKTEGDKK